MVTLIMLTVSLSLPAVRLQEPAQTPAPDIRQFVQVTPDFCTGGQPRPTHFAELKARGVKAVLNLRTPGEHRAEEEHPEAQRVQERKGDVARSDLQRNDNIE